MRYVFVLSLSSALTFAAPPSALAQRSTAGAPVTPSDRGASVEETPPVWIATRDGFRELRVRVAHGEDSLDGPTHLTVEAVTDDVRIDREDLVGQRVTVGVRHSAGTLLRNGTVVDARVSVGVSPDTQEREAFVLLQIEDDLHRLRRAVRSAMYEAVTDVEALEATFARHPDVSVELRVRRALPVRAHVAQYEESDFGFVYRLADRSGLVIRTEHRAHGHTIVVEDADFVPRVRTTLTVGEQLERIDVNAMPGPSGYLLYDGDHLARALRPGARVEQAVALRVAPEGSAAALRRRAAALLAAANAPIVSASGEIPGEIGTRVRVRGAESSEANADFRVVRQSWMAAGPMGVRVDMELRAAGVPLVVMHRNPPGVGMQSAEVLRVEGARARLRLDWTPDGRGRFPECWVALDGLEPPRPGARVHLGFEHGDPERPFLLR